MPRDKVKYSELTLLVETEACGSTYSKRIHDINPSPKPNSFRTLNANIQKLVFWVQDSSLPWCNLEAKSCVSSSLPAMVFSSLPMSPSHYTDNPIVCSSLKIFFQFLRHFKFTSASTMAPIHKNHLFLPPFSDSVFSLWEKKGLKCFEDLFINNVFASFSELSL